jgi:hypothetical protein
MGGERIEFDFEPERVGKPDAIKYLDGRIESLRQMVVNRPGPDEALNEYEVLHWQRRFMAHYGKVLGNLECLGNFGVLPLAMCQKYKTKIQIMLQHHIGAVMIGKT